MDINEKLQHAATVADALADAKRSKDERLVDDARRAAVLRGHGYFAADASEWN